MLGANVAVGEALGAPPALLPDPGPDQGENEDREGGDEEGGSQASTASLWWPPHKVSGRYLPAWLVGEEPREDPSPPRHSLEVEVSLPSEWHREPMALDPYGPLTSE